VQLLREAVPTIRRIGYLYQAGMVGIGSFLAGIESIGRKLGLAVFLYAMERPEQLPTMLEAMRNDGVDALRVSYVGAVQAVTAQVLEFAASARIATSFTVPTPVERGGLMSYSPRLSENAARAAALVDKLLKGAAAAQLPFEYPTRYELVVNVKTAKQLGFALPAAFLASADRLIE
jgi:putative ABC transport system substrate-binding protein